VEIVELLVLLEVVVVLLGQYMEMEMLEVLAVPRSARRVTAAAVGDYFLLEYLRVHLLILVRVVLLEIFYLDQQVNGIILKNFLLPLVVMAELELLAILQHKNLEPLLMHLLVLVGGVDRFQCRRPPSSPVTRVDLV
jgi:hypothetical protein